MKRFLAAAILLLCLAISIQGFGQSNSATVSGTVSDASGAFIPGVSVTATNTQTGVVATNVSNETGTYNFVNLQPGTYKISGELPGFQTQTYTDVQLGNAQQVRLNFKLQVSTVSQAVEVTVAADTLLATSSSSVGTVLPESRVRDLPVVGRDALELVNIMAGIREAADPTQSNSRNQATIAGISVAAANTTRDGISVQDNRYNLGVFSATHLNPDMVGEMRIILAPVDAETGRGAGQVQILTRSGTNRFMGSAVLNIQNSALNANSWANNRTATPLTWYNRPQLSVNYAGPIVKNKTFFFALFDGQRMYSRQNVRATVLTDAARRGLFRYFPGVQNGNADALVTSGASPTAPVVDRLGNPVKPAAATGDLQTVSIFGRDSLRPGFDKTGYVQRVIAGMPQPNDFTGGDGLNTAVFKWVRRGDSLIGGQQGVEDDVYRNQYNVKVDHNFSQRHKFNISYTNESLKSTTGQPNYPSETDWKGKTTRKPQVLTASFVSTLTPNIVNEFRTGLRRSNSLTLYPYDHPDTKDAVLAFLPSANGYPIIGLPAAGTVDISNNQLNPGLNTNGNKSPLWTFADSLSFTKGKHAYKGGAELRMSRSWGINSLNGIPHVTGGAGNAAVQGIDSGTVFPSLVGTNITNARNLLLALSGSVGSITQAFILNDPKQTEFHGYLDSDGYLKEREWDQNELSFFFKDDWKLRPSFSLNLGVRYEYYGVPYEASGLTAALVGGGLAGFGYSGRSFADYWNFGPRKGEDSTIEFVGKNSPNPGKQIYQDDWNNFAPAVGFSWSLPWLGKDKTTLRGGYGISYQGGGRGLDLDNAISGMPGLGDAPVFAPSTFTDLSNISLPLARNKPFQPVPLTQRNTTLTVFDPNYVSPYVQNFTMSLTREVRRNVTADVRYIGTKGTKLFGTVPLNQANFVTNGLLQALDITRAGGDAPLFDQMLKGLVINTGQAAVGTAGVTGSAALRQNTTYRTNIANGTYSAIANGGATSFNQTNLATGVAGGLLRNGGLPENFIVNNPQFSAVNVNTNSSSSTYHSMQAQVTVGRWSGMNYQATYVWSKGISDCSGTNCTGWVNAVDRRLNKTVQASDRRHDFRINGSYELPFGPGRRALGNSHGVLARLVEQWQLSWIFNVNSGQPLSVTGVNNFLGSGRLDIVGDFPKDQGNAQMTSGLPKFFDTGTYSLVPDPQCGRVTTAQTTSTSCTLNALANAQGQIVLQQSAPGRLGNLGDNWLTGPGSFRFDLSAAKSVKINESKSLQFRVDARNVLNHPILGNPNLNINSANFGQITDVSGARQFQAQLRFNF